MPPKDLSSDPMFQEFVLGRTAQDQVDYIKRYGSHALPEALRRRELFAAGIEKPQRNAENVVYFGCYQLPRYAHTFGRYLRLLQMLGVEYTFLDYEVCCGDPVVETTLGKDREEALEAARGFIRQNAEAAMQVGGKNLVYFCIWCVYVARQVDPDGEVRHLFYPDIAVDKLKTRQAEIAPTVIGYYQGCQRRGKHIAPEVSLNLDGCREALSSIKGLKIVDLNSSRCCVDIPTRIIDEAEGQNIQTIVSVCSACNTRLASVGKGRVRTQFYMDFLCDVFGVPKY